MAGLRARSGRCRVLTLSLFIDRWNWMLGPGVKMRSEWRVVPGHVGH